MIERFIVPIRLETDYVGRKKDETLFVFPFDHDHRNAEDAYSDISEKLRSLDYPLLFLSNLKDISFEISGNLGLYGKTFQKTYHFDNTTAELIRLTQNNDENYDDLYDDRLWLFSRNTDGGHKYAVGFFVGDDGHLIAKSHSAFCFFPTREATGLNFILHAPFLLTDSREGIRAGVQYNTDLISLLSKLAADSLVYLKEIEQATTTPLIDDNIFDIVPYDENHFTDLNSKNRISFKPFYMAIKEAFRTQEIIPSSDGYAATNEAYWSSVTQIAELFSNKQLSLMRTHQAAKWVFTSFGRQDTLRKNKTLTTYIDSITKSWLDEDRILNGITAQFIEPQSIEWLHRFYKWIAETTARTELIKMKPIFLDQHGNAVAAFDDMNQAILFLPTEGGSGYITIHPDLLQNEETHAFIKKLGIAEPSLRDEIYNIILPQYTDDNDNLNLIAHFKKFFRYYQQCSHTEARLFLDLIKGRAFILNQTALDATLYRDEASNLYFLSEDLQQWFQAKPETSFVCFDEYLQLIGADNEDDLIRFFTDLGVRDIPRILSFNLNSHEAHAIQEHWAYSTKSQSWTDKCIDGSEELIERLIKEQDLELSKFVWSQLLQLIKQEYFKGKYYWIQDSVLYGKYEYFYRTSHSESFESSEARRLRTQPWLVNSAGEFVSANELTVQTLHPQYDLVSDEAKELLRVLQIKEEIQEIEVKEANLSSFAEKLGLSNEEQRQALLEFAKRKQAVKAATSNQYDADQESAETGHNSSVKRVVEEIKKRVTSASKERVRDQNARRDPPPADEDDYSKPAVDINKKIEKVKEQAEREIKEIAHLEDLKQQAQEADRYSYAWFKALLELEAANSNEYNVNNREISIAFSKVEREEGTTRTLILKHPNRYIPQFVEDLADIPLELHFADQSMVKVAIEVVNVKSYTLRVKLRTNAQIDGLDLSLVVEARIEAKSPVFLLEELRKAFIKLGDENGYSNEFNMQKNLCENIEFVFGPPGTGKTTYLARNVILPMMRQTVDLKVLVLAPTNKAADVLVRRLMESMGSDQSYLNWLVRFGATNDNIIEQSGVARDKTFDLRTFSRNVTVTTIARFPYDYFLPDDGTRLHLNALKWDYIIFDEASMIPLANIVYPLYKKTPEKFIVAGDPFQIEPITTVAMWQNENIYTFVNLKSFANPTTIPHQYPVELLTTQYRSIPEIGEVFNQFAYDGVLNHFRDISSQRPLPIRGFIDLKPLNIIKFPVSKYESIYRSKRLQSKTPYQVYSALFAFEFVKYLSSLIEQVKGNELFRIGLIAPYRAQSDLIDKLMSSIVLPKNVDVQVGTIHGFQGDECDIVVTLFNPPPSINSSNKIFLNKLNIINVSISRARDYLFILMPDDATENIDKLTLIKKVELLCKCQPLWGEYHSPSIEEMIFGSKTYLEDNAFSTSHQPVNVYRKPEKRYEVRSEDNAIDVQLHE